MEKCEAVGRYFRLLSGRAKHKTLLALYAPNDLILFKTYIYFLNNKFFYQPAVSACSIRLVPRASNF